MKPEDRGTALPSVPATASDARPADADLRAALRALPLDAADAARITAISQRAMADWQQRHGAGATAAGQRGPALALRLWQHRLWVGSAGLVAVAALATAVMVTRPDPSIEELMQPDVLSQMAIGEM